MHRDDRKRLADRRQALGERIKILRAYRNFSQDDLIRESGVGRNTIQRTEAGETSMRLTQVWKLADGLRVPVTWLLSDDWTWPTRGGAGGGEWPDEAPPKRYP
ncbi:helix-turn-helix domain-containing protein [Streptacidiphilus sp. N1-12]|uniref:Helix-turn-helix domain-containing protein n=2 Tax=Streptacidiphilus alkalitolerans TaxID=3342712 RepID=A0ABV6VAA7_9ACTN